VDREEAGRAAHGGPKRWQWRSTAAACLVQEKKKGASERAKEGLQQLDSGVK
jgi:hypothetical protein